MRGPEHKESLMHRSVRLAALTVLAVLGVPAAAQAHTASGSVGCTGADIHYVNFRPGANVVHYRVRVDGQTVTEAQATIGRTGTVHVPLALNDTHTVAAFAWWLPSETVDHVQRAESSPPVARRVVVCPPAPAPVAPPAPVAAPPAPAPAPVAAPAPEVHIGTPLVVRHRRAKRCVHGVIRRDRHGRRLRDSKGRRIAVCRRAPGRKVGRTVTPKFTG